MFPDIRSFQTWCTHPQRLIEIAVVEASLRVDVDLVAAHQAVDRVRELTKSLPEATEAVDKFGHTSFRVRDKPVVMMGEGSRGPSMAIKTTLDKQKSLIEQGEFVRKE